MYFVFEEEYKHFFSIEEVQILHTFDTIPHSDEGDSNPYEFICQTASCSPQRDSVGRLQNPIYFHHKYSKLQTVPVINSF